MQTPVKELHVREDDKGNTGVLIFKEWIEFFVGLYRYTVI